MTYAEKMVMEIMEKVTVDYGNSEIATKIVNQIIADTKRACIHAYVDYHTIGFAQKGCLQSMEQAEVKEAKDDG